METHVGNAPDSWGVWFPDDPTQVPWQQFMDEVAEAGYEWIELGPHGYLPTDVPTLRSELDKRRLKISGTFAMPVLEEKSGWPQVEKAMLNAGEQVASLGGKFLLLIDDVYCDLYTGNQHAPTRLDESAWKRLIENTHKAADLVRDRFQLKLVFHPHADTHVEYEDQIEALLEQTDPERVGLCLDTGHHAYRGGDPVAFMRRHSKRIHYLHLKNVDGKILEEVEQKNMPLATAVGMGVFCEPWHGKVDFLAFRDLLREINYSGWVIVEQDMRPAPPGKPLQVARATRDWLREVGIG